MSAIDDLKKLLALETPKEELQDWVLGKIPKHYKRLSISREKALELAKIGQAKAGAYYGERLYFTQALIFGAMTTEDYDNISIVTCSQYGKLIEDNELVLTRNGWKKHGDLVVGDEVISPNGEFVKVLYVHPKGYTNRIVEFFNGDKVECHENHEWVISEYSGPYKTVETKYIQEKLSNKTNGRFVLPKIEPVKGEHKKLPVDPYVLGVWLGDGSTTKGQICSSKQDIAVLDECRKFYPNGAEWVHKDTGVITRSFKGLATDLGKYDMCFQYGHREKYIPDDYLTASYEQRLRLLAGLIDTDGCTDKNSRTVFSTTNENLRDGIETLVHSFGWKTSTTAIPPRTSSSGVHGKKTVYVVGFNASSEIPCVLERKRPFRFAKQKRLGIKNIYECEPHQGNCITVEGGVYCVGRHLIPTHNSWLMGRVAVVRAYEGHKQFVSATTGDGTDIIMNYVIQAISNATEELQLAVEGMSRNKLDRLATSLSKTRIAFPNRGSVEAITLGDNYLDTRRNKAIGRGGDYIVDESAFVSDESRAEMGRSELNRIDGKKSQFVGISNPHQAGWFYDTLIEENIPERNLVIWTDALTCLEEQRFSKEQILNSEYAKNKRTCKQYWLCELDTTGDSMFETPKLYDGHKEFDYPQYFLGEDSAYKGKDNICYAIVIVGDDGNVYVDDLGYAYKGEWIDGKTSEDIIMFTNRIINGSRISKECVDIGYGVWLVEGLARLGHNVTGVNFGAGATKERVKARHYSATNATNLRAEMHLDLQNLIDDGKLYMNREVWKRVQDIFPFVVAERKNNGKIQVRPKAEIKAMLGRSPDELDAILLAIHAMITFGSENYEYIT